MSPEYRAAVDALRERQLLITRLVDRGHLELATICRRHLHAAMGAWIPFESQAVEALA